MTPPAGAVASAPEGPVLRVAVLDDYQGLGRAAFEAAFPSDNSGGSESLRLPPSIVRVDVTSFTAPLPGVTDADVHQLAAQLGEFDVISTMRERTPVGPALAASLAAGQGGSGSGGRLRLLLTTGMRNAALDLDALAQHGVAVAGTRGTPDAGPPAAADTTAQHALALMLAAASRLGVDARRVVAPAGGGNGGEQAAAPAWQSGVMTPLAGRTLGVVGLGRLGAAFARMCVQALGMRVLCWSPNLTQARADAAAAAAGLASGTFTAVDKDTVFASADVVSLHLVLSASTRGVIGARELALMRPDAILVNTARAGLVDEAALLDALRRRALGAAALDVFWEEPLQPDSPWRSPDWGAAVVLSPHMGYVSGPTIRAWYREQTEELARWLAGEPLKNRLA